jgi:hypothetical protein
LEGEITDKSDVMDGKRHYVHMPLQMEAGDMLHVVYHSKDFVTALIIRDSSGSNQVQKIDDPMMFDVLGSEAEGTYKAEVTGTAYMVFTTKDLDKTGKFKVELLYYSARANKITSSSSFCSKVKYVAENSTSNFVFLRGKKTEGFGTSYEPSVKVFANKSNNIREAGGGISYSADEQFTDEQEATAEFDRLEKELMQCLTGYTKTVYTKETMSDFEKKYYTRKIGFVLKGKNDWDLNTIHPLSKMKNEVELYLEPSSGKYEVQISIR